MLKKKKSTARKKSKRQLGDDGENQAIKYLLDQGFQILDRNFQVKHKEIDIIAFDQELQEVVFIEVKMRKSGKFGHPSLAVSQKKLNHINIAAQIYLDKKGLANNYRFDIISILPHKLEHFKNVSFAL
ncbi:MAG: YraN family protein [Patescibacteria group bacterium]|nr:YraN family protein [Patescibacteria group bacterium]